MRLDEYINMTDTPDISATSTAASLLGTVYSEAAFLTAFAPQNPPIPEKQQQCSAVVDPAVTSIAWHY